MTMISDGDEYATGTWAEFEEHVTDLLAAIDDAHIEWPKSQLAVMNGWSCPKVLYDDARTHPLRDFFTGCLPEHDGHEWELSGWANLMDKGHGLMNHDHVRSQNGGNNTWAGVLWLTIPEGTSPLVVHLNDGSSIEVVPWAGGFCLFTAYTMHEAASQRVNGVRTSMPFNARQVSAGGA